MGLLQIGEPVVEIKINKKKFIRKMNASFKTSYTLSNASNGVYVFVLEGSLTIGGWMTVEKRWNGCLWTTRNIDKINPDGGFY